MSRLQSIGGRMTMPLQIIGGARTRGIFIPPSDTADPGIEFAYPRTTLRVANDSLVQPGQTIHCKRGVFLVARHSQADGYRTHTLFECDRQVAWTRVSKTIHPISRQEMSSTTIDLGQIYVMWERTRREFVDLALRVSQESYLVATGAPVQLGDLVDGKTVKRVSEALGVRVLELQG